MNGKAQKSVFSDHNHHPNGVEVEKPPQNSVFSDHNHHPNGVEVEKPPQNSVSSDHNHRIHPNGVEIEKPSQNSVSLDHNHHPNGVEIEKPPEAEKVMVEIEYIESEDLSNITDVEAVLKSLLIGLDSKDWVSICDALNTVRRLSIFHKEEMLQMLEKVIILVVKSLKNPRSAVSKTACMTSADIFSSYNDHIIDQLDPLLTQLLLKSSQDKRFVCEAAEKALVSMTTHVSPTLLLPKLQPCLKHKNPRIRAKASICFSQTVPRLGIEGIREYGIEKLVQAAASQLTDQLPESREAARLVLLELQSVYTKTNPSLEHPETWQIFCQSNLSPLSALAVLRVTTNVAVTPQRRFIMTTNLENLCE